MPPLSITITGESFAALVANTNTVAAALNAGLAGGATDTPAPAAAPTQAPKATRTRNRPEADSAPAAVPAPAPAAVTGVTKEAVVKKLVTLINAADAVGKNGKQVCTDLCLKFGGKNASAIDPAKYAEVVAEVDKELAKLSEDPTA